MRRFAVQRNLGRLIYGSAQIPDPPEIPVRSLRKVSWIKIPQGIRIVATNEAVVREDLDVCRPLVTGVFEDSKRPMPI